MKAVSMNNINFMNLNNFHKLATITTSSIGTLLLTLSPALALTFGFCGTFDDGGSVDGKISVQDDGSFGNYANILTTKPGAEDRRYNTSNFVSIETNAIHPELNIAAYKYTFNYTETDVVYPFPDNKFEFYIPASIFPITPGVRPELSQFETIPQYEMRDNELRKDPDQLAIVPEPTSVLGTAIAIGLGSLMTKINLKKLKQD